MAKQPIEGGTKTRLVPPFTFTEAANLSRALFMDTFDLVASITAVDIAVGVTPPAAISYFQQITPQQTNLLPVEGEDIGACLHAVTAELFTYGYQKVLAMNSDGPSLPAEYLSRAIGLLDNHDVIFGPNDDGGYYLVGLLQPQPRLFQEISWSTQQVLKQSLTRSAELGLGAGILPSWHDVDTAEDFKHLMDELNAADPPKLPHTRLFLSQLTPPRLIDLGKLL